MHSASTQSILGLSSNLKCSRTESRLGVTKKASLSSEICREKSGGPQTYDTASYGRKVAGVPDSEWSDVRERQRSGASLTRDGKSPEGGFPQRRG
jgi:hypothetical protein